MEVVVLKAVIGKLTHMIGQQVTEEIALVFNFTQDFKWLTEKLTNISDHLEYADSQATQVEPVKRWQHRLRDVAWDAEDIVEECAVSPLYTSCVTKSCVCNLNDIFFRRRMGKRIQEVRKEIKSIMEEGKNLKLIRDIVSPQPEQPSCSATRKENCLLPTDSHPVAIEPRLQHLISLIDKQTDPVIAVVGIGGAGKTFLLKNVYDRIQQRYEPSIWLSISQLYTVHNLQCDIASHLGDLLLRVKQVTEERAGELIHAALQGTKSLIVLDDIWRCAEDHNIIERLGLPIGPESQCKVVVTTRSMEVSIKLGAFPYKMELLSEEESWQLFCVHAFGVDLPPDHLQVIAHQVEKQCGRLPLALKIVGASLSGCTEKSQWNSKLHQLIEVDLSKDPVIKILRLSYDSLPSALKLCFSYLSFFPEDKLIDREYLINLWIAEGFIPQNEDQWKAGCTYFDQLAGLCLLEKKEDERLIKHCKIHDLLLDLAIAISKENRCTFAVEDDFTSVKRILLGRKKIDDMVIAQSRSLRTLALYETPIEKIEEKFVSPMRLLRVLDLSRTKVSTLPHCVGKLKLLKLLNLSRTEIKEVPICVRSLKSLLFLDLSDCEQLRRLPEWITELKCLQHLNIIYCNNELLSHMPKGISELVSLRVLRSEDLRLSVEEDGLLKLEDVAKLTRLQELSLEVNHEMQLNSIQDGTLAQLLEMRHLSITSALQDLQTLKIKNFAVPNWVCVLTDLTQLKLVDYECSNYPKLEAMPNLEKLTLDGNNSCTELPKAFGKSSQFRKLRFLSINNFPHLEGFPDLEDGAMAVLERFYSGLCPRVKKVPEGLKWLTKLRKFYYSGRETDDLNQGRKFWDKIKAKYPHVGIIESFI